MKARTLLIKMEINGKGIVNLDSSDQRWIYNAEDRHVNKSSYDNVNYAKRNFYRDDTGKLFSKLKISRDCMMKSAFRDDLVAHTSNIMHHDALLYSYIASPFALVRGYMLPGDVTLKRKSPLTLAPAEQTCSAVPYMETFSKSGQKISKESKDDKSDNTFYKMETVGDVSYEAKGSIDLTEMQFVGCDQILDRLSFNPDGFEMYKQMLSMRLPGNIEMKYYKLKNSVVDIAELGILLSDEQTAHLVKLALKKLAGMHIIRKNAYAKTAKLFVKFVSDPLVDTYSNPDGWVDVTSMAAIDSLEVQIDQAYVEVDQIEEKAKRDAIKAALDADKKAKSDKKKKQKGGTDEVPVA